MSISSRHVIIVTSLIFAIVFAASEVKSVAQEQWEAYQPRTLSELVKRRLNELSNQATKSTRITYLLTSNEFPSRVRVVYSGHKRAIRPEKKEVILEWAKARGMSQEVVNLQRRTTLFRERKGVLDTSPEATPSRD